MKRNAWFQLQVMGAISLAALVGIFLWKFPDSSSEWAAWVQAFGAIGAILAASAIASRQSSQARREEAERRIAHLKGVLGLFDDVHNTVNVTLANMQERGGLELINYVQQRKHPMEVVLEAVRRIQFHEVPLVYLGGFGLNYLNVLSTIVQTLEYLARETWSVDDHQQSGRLDRGTEKVAYCAKQAAKNMEAMRGIVRDYDGIKSPRITLSDLADPVGSKDKRQQRT